MANSQPIVIASDQSTVPVNIASSSLVGLQVNLTKVTTSTLAGLRVYQENASSVTVASSTLVGLQMNLTKATTSVLAGLKTFVENFPATQNVAITGATTSVLAGLKVLVENPVNSVTATIASTSLAGLIVGGKYVSAKPTLANNQTNELQLDVNGNANVNLGTLIAGEDLTNNRLNTNITAATTSVLAGLKIDIERTITLPVNITATTTSVLAGVKVDIERSITLPVNLTTATTSVLAGIGVDNRDGNGVKLTSTGAALDVNLKTSSITPNVNITAATTSVLAGLQVQLENKSVPIVTTTVVGITSSASGDNQLLPAPGSGKRIYVYAWNLSFSGTVNAKFTDALTSKVLCGLLYGVANAGGGNSVNPNFLLTTPQPDLFHTSTNSRLLLNLSGATAVGGSISYFVI